MKRDKWLILSIIILVMLNLFSLGMLWHTRVIQKPGKTLTERPAPTRGSRFLYKALDLNDEQKAKVGEIQRQHVAAMRRMEGHHQKIRRTYIDIALGPQYNSARGDSLLEKMAAINAQMQEETWGLFRRVYKEFSPVQQQKYRKLILEMNRRQAQRSRPPVPFPNE